ncbi:ABC-type nitrate/sulfonate/bicarbonate transport system permease component [Saccharomonospora amisosensis]|uniref:ABC-type nitrate/sulfonate/bicarbonate transport system permease component n=1 Tax=Saccharomonospora amisosensis TaxID=1128677 RepID=A0A7X5ZRA0_9PSEU|nr:ABC transporter permease [Saccharomonospora amisosensis]NIJ12311.1 ABC-type nitrate/sulfonate/bicarbonate transport system permease component [Saccharomonospora amisosensis]
MSPSRRRWALIALEAGVPLAVLAGWWIWSASAGSFYFPPLADILATFADTWLFDRFATDVLPSLRRLAAGFLIAVVIGITVGTLLGLSATARRVAGPIVEFGRAVPPPALLPFGMLVLGVGDTMKIFIIAVVCLWPVLLNTIDGVRGVDPTMLDTARVYGIRGGERLRSIVLPAALPQVFAGMRTSLSLALILMVISEMVASTAGIGYFVLESQRSFAIPEMWSGIVLLGVLGYLLNAALAVVERRVLSWHRGAKASALQ